MMQEFANQCGDAPILLGMACGFLSGLSFVLWRSVVRLRRELASRDAS